jgi:general secretion pathway protein H
VLELTVVMLVMGALALTALGGLRRDAGPNARILAREAALALRRTRAVALAADQPARFTIDLDRRSFAGADGRALTIPPQAETRLEDLAVAGRRGTILFLPDGGSSGGTITFAVAGRSATVAADWLTGAVTVGPVMNRPLMNRP